MYRNVQQSNADATTSLLIILLFLAPFVVIGFVFFSLENPTVTEERMPDPYTFRYKVDPAVYAEARTRFYTVSVPKANQFFKAGGRKDGSLQYRILCRELAVTWNAIMSEIDLPPPLPDGQELEDIVEDEPVELKWN